MKIKVGIVGYGNLGKAVEKQIEENADLELIAIFSHRNLPNVVDYEKILDFVGQIDVLFLCSGSFSDLEDQAYQLIENFNTIDAFDNHNKIKNYLHVMNQKAMNNQKVAFCSFGWDPGLFSLMRGLIDGLGYEAYTFWGRGLSQGHTQAIKTLPHVIDALQFTVPNNIAENDLAHGWDVSTNMHKRECFVVCDEGYESDVENAIKTMPDYFLGYETYVKFVDQTELDKMKSFAHKGKVLTKGNFIEFSLNLKSNPDFTANVMVTYAKALIKFQKQNCFGAYTILDLPMSLIVKRDFEEIL